MFHVYFAPYMSATTFQARRVQLVAEMRFLEFAVYSTKSFSPSELGFLLEDGGEALTASRNLVPPKVLS